MDSVKFTDCVTLTSYSIMKTYNKLVCKFVTANQNLSSYICMFTFALVLCGCCLHTDRKGECSTNAMLPSSFISLAHWYMKDGSQNSRISANNSSGKMPRRKTSEDEIRKWTEHWAYWNYDFPNSYNVNIHEIKSRSSVYYRGYQLLNSFSLKSPLPRFNTSYNFNK